MNKKQLRAELAKLKLMYADGVFPTAVEIKMTPENISTIEAIVELATKKYLTYCPPSVVEDDEGILHRFARGYRMTQKAIDLLEGV